MNAFDVWLVVVGLAIGAGLAWLVMVDLRRRDDDISARELPAEAAWIADMLRRAGMAADPEAVEEVLRLHRAYLAGIPDEDGWRPRLAVGDDGAIEHVPDDALERDLGDEAGGPRSEDPRSGDPRRDAAGPSGSGASGAAAEPEPEPLDEEAQAAHDALDALLSRTRPDDRARPED